MIPNLTEFAEKLGFTAVLVRFVLAGRGFLTQSLAQWFDEQNP
jgi:hypothetical protein